METHHPDLTSAELATLWTQYMNDTLGLCVNRYMLEIVEDSGIRSLIEYAIHLGESHVEKIKTFLSSDNFPIPQGFTDHDVNMKTPRLFTDQFCLHFLNIMSIHGCHAYSAAVTSVSREDVRHYFTECNASAIELCNRTKAELLNKGIYFRAPHISPPVNIEFIKSENFLTGWLGDKRPLNCIEITDLIFNLKKSFMAKALSIAFSQVVKSKDARNFLIEATEIKKRHTELFCEVLRESDLPSPPDYDSEITNSTVAPFSDKLMMFLMGFLYKTALVYYGTGMAASPRRDLVAKYGSVIVDDIAVESKWMNIMINNSWLEQPFLASDRKALVYKG
ncbi:MAG TPA: DUF3231 family protein [Bacillota bacterium]|nr:DUF3231 family protein [Bacillota bacterium]